MTARQPRRPGRPLPQGRAFYPADASDRRRLERSSARYLAYLHQLPRWLPPLVMAGLLVAGLAVGGWFGAAALVIVAGFLAWLAALSWPALHRQGRVLRVAAIAAVLLAAAVLAIRGAR